MSFRGERFNIDLPDGENEETSKEAPSPFPPGSVKDISERTVSRVVSASAPVQGKSFDGFPKLKKRTAKSKTGQSGPVSGTSRAGDPPRNSTADEASSGTSNTSKTSVLSRGGLDETEQRSIDQENERKLASMSLESIAKERQDLLENLSPEVINKLLNYPKHSGGTKVPGETPVDRHVQNATEQHRTNEVGNDDQSLLRDEQHDEQWKDPSRHSDLPCENIPQIHFPKPPDPPSLDPSAPSFLDDLHAKYFPSLPPDPSKLAWMSSSTPVKSPYDLANERIPVAALRFAFDGTLLAPRTAKEIPVTAGLHHHGDDPDTAGYTIAELAHLARSTFPAQRCIAFQTLGRILYRLGVGEFGNSDSIIAIGLWKCVEQGKILQSLQEESGRFGGHVSAKAYATEALWLWQKGGGRRWQAQ